MNLFQAANGAATFLILSALVAGLAKQLDLAGDGLVEFMRTHYEMATLGIFVVVFRIKTLVDDNEYFDVKSTSAMNPYRFVGFVFAIFSWLFWALGAYVLVPTTRAAELIALSIVISTIWLITHIIEMLVSKKPHAEVRTRLEWIVMNVAYLLLLIAHSDGFRPFLQPGGELTLILLLIVLLYDVLRSQLGRAFPTVTAAAPSDAAAACFVSPPNGQGRE